MSPLTIIDADGNAETISGDTGVQYTPEGFNTGLATNSVPLETYLGGVGLYQRMYMRQLWVKVCVDKLTDLVLRLPLKVYERDSQGDKRRVLKGPLVDAIRTPAKRRGPAELKQWLIKPALIHGTAALRIRRAVPGGPPAGFEKLLWPYLEPRTLDPQDNAAQADYWRYTANPKKPEILQPEDVLVIAKDPPRGVAGVSPLRPLAITLMIERAAQLYQAHSFRNSVRPPGGVTLPDNELAKDPEFRKAFSDELTRLQGGVENAGKPLTLPPGAKWEAFAYSAKDAELIDQRKLNREEVAAGYDVAPPLIGILDHATYSNITELQRALYQTTMPPWLTLIEDALLAQVIAPEPAFDGQWVEFDLNDVLRGDPIKEAASLKAGINGGGMTLNEARSVRNQPPIDHPNANVPLVPANNLLPITQLGNNGGVDNVGDDEPPAAAALRRNITRAGDRIYRQMKAGETDGWSPERFERELHADLTTAGMNGDAASTAKAWAGALEAIVAHAAGDPDVLRVAIAALATETGAD